MAAGQPAPAPPERAPSEAVQPQALESVAPGQWIMVWSGRLPNGGSDPDILLARLTYPDCNGNGVLDAVEIADGGVPDANNNGVPDECDPEPGPNTPTNGDRPGWPCATAPAAMAGVFVLFHAVHGRSRTTRRVGR